MAGVEARRVAKDDPRRLAVGVLSVGMSGGYRGFTGQATVLGPGVAITSPNLRGEALRLWDEGSAVSHFSSDDVAVDGDLGFRVLRFDESHAVPYFARSVLPTLGGEYRIVWYDYSRNDFFELTGSVAPGPKNRFNLHLEGDAGIALVGAPVFTDQFVMGMVASGPHPNTSTSRPDGTFVVEVLSVAAMAESTATPIVRDLFRRAEKRQSTGPSMEGEARLGSLEKNATLDVREEELWERLRPSARDAVARAEGIRRALRKNKVHTEYLIAGLFPAWRRFFARRNVTEATLNAIVRDKFVVDLPDFEIMPGLDRLPPLSQNVREALLQAAGNADKRGSRGIWSSHLLHGVLSVDGSKTVQALRELGIRREDIRPEDEEPGSEDTHVSQYERSAATGSPEGGGGEPRPDTSGPPDSRGRLSPHVSAEPSTAQTAVALNAETLARLSQPARSALERAEGMRATAGLKEIHMEQLVAGLLERGDGPMRQFFGKSQINEDELRRIVHEVSGREIPSSYSPRALNAFPPVSTHASRAVEEGVRLSAEEPTKQIESRHLLYGALSVDECDLIKALKESGVRRDDVAQVPRTAIQAIELFYSYTKRDDPFREALEKHLGILQQEGLVKSWSGLSISAGDRAGDIADRLNSAQVILLLVSPNYLEDRFNVSEMERAVERQRKGEAQVVPVILRPIGLSEAEFPITGLPALPEGRVPISEFANHDEGFRNVADGLRKIIPTITLQARPISETNAAPTPMVDSDLWCVNDCLGYEAYARTLADLITSKKTVPPLTIGIKAPWGAGKTSLMKRVQHLLDGDAKVTERNEAGFKEMWQQSRMTLWSLLTMLKRKPIIVNPNRHQSGEKAGPRTKKLLKNAVRVDAVKPKASTEAQRSGYQIPPRITVWFNAWRYQTSEQIWAGMAHCMISQITARMNSQQRELFWLRLRARRINADEVRWRIWETVLRQVLPFALAAAAICVLLFGALLVVPVLFPALALSPKTLMYLERSIPFVWILATAWKTGAKLGDKAAGAMRELVREPNYEEKMGYLAHVESDIRDVLKLASVTRTQPLVVFVDDLDRCAPNKVAEVVEAINLFLCGDYPNCIFVLAMEPGMVAAALEVANKDVIDKAKEWGFGEPTVPLGWRFMEKIVQLPIMIPPPTERGQKSYVESLTRVHEGNAALLKAYQDIDSRIKKYFGEEKSLFRDTAIDGPANPLGELEETVGAREIGNEQPQEEVVAKYEKEIEDKTIWGVQDNSKRVLAEAPQNEQRAAAEAAMRAYARVSSERDAQIMEIVREAAQLVGGNPRQIKRYANVFRFYCTLRFNLARMTGVRDEDMPLDKMLAKFVALSIHWPHAVDCLRMKKEVSAGGGNGQAMSRLESLEDSARITGKEAPNDEAWKKIVSGMGLKDWAEAAAFREFLAKGELLGKSRGHGLW